MLVHKLSVVGVLLCTAFSLAQTAFPDHCTSGTPLPFAAIQKKQPIDQSCAIKGRTTSPPNSQTQNQVKNNFCSSATAPEAFTPQMLVSLQQKTKVPSGYQKEPSDRKALEALGEGKVVRMKAYLLEAHHADLGTGPTAGESVNCNNGTPPFNDVHIALGPQSATKECDSVTAEISPHYRPATWDAIGNFEVFSGGKYVVNPGMAARLQAHPYRITGQLFFDASHQPCPCGSIKCEPLRSSVWEIHPVYQIEVCKAGTPCDEANDADWLAFDTWWKSLAPIQPVKPPHSHAHVNQ
jgi:hypothetical protein